MSTPLNDTTEAVNPAYAKLDLMGTGNIVTALWQSQQQALLGVQSAATALSEAIDAAAERLVNEQGRLVLVGAGASGRLAVQDGAELWPTYGWPHQRLLLQMAGGLHHTINSHDVVVAIAASGRSRWTCAWLQEARARGALAVAMANNADTPLLHAADHALFLASGEEVLAGSTRMAAGTAQKVALNIFSTGIMVRLNRTYGNLMVDMAAVNHKLDGRRQRMLRQIVPDIDDDVAEQLLQQAGGWVKLAAVLAHGVSADHAKQLLDQHAGSLRAVLAALPKKNA